MVGPSPPKEPPTQAIEMPQQLQAVPWLAVILRSLARLWVVGLLVAGAAFCGVALNQMYQAENQLRALRREPGPEAYAIVAYRRELERQLEAYRQRRTSDVVPTPPLRPRLLEEIDLARQRNRDLSETTTAPRAVYSPVISAPE
jgi:hypothetical protein